MNQIAIFDCLDTLQGYVGAPDGAAKKHYQSHLARVAGMPLDEFLASVPYEDQLRLTGEEIRRGGLTPRLMDGASEVLSYLRNQGVEPIIVTADIPEAAALTTRPIVETGLVSAERVYAIHHLGSKKQAETWARAKQQYFADEKTISVYEDTPENLEAALTAYRVPYSADGLPFGFLVDAQAATMTRLPNRILRGNLRSLIRPDQGE